MTAAEHMTDRKERMAAANQRASEELHINETPTDSGNAYRFARLFKDKVKYVPEKKSWIIWNGKLWQYDESNQTLDMTLTVCTDVDNYLLEISDKKEKIEWTNWARTSKSLTRRKSMLELAATLREIVVYEKDLDIHPYLFNFVTCTLNFEPPRICFSHNSDNNITKICPTPYEPNAKSRLLDEFLDRFMPDKEERIWNLTSLAVAAFTGRNMERKLLMLLGPSSTGKSALMELMQASLGYDYTAAVNASVFRGNMDDKPRPDLVRASDSQFIMAFEASEQWDLHVDHIKRMTGGDPLVMRGMKSDSMKERIAKFTPCIIANVPPKIRGSDNAIRRRLHVLLMDQTVDPVEDDGKKRIELVNNLECRIAFIALLVQLYVESDGILPMNVPPRIAAKTMEVFAALDSVDEIIKMLIEEAIIIHDTDIPASHCIKTMDLHKAICKILNSQHIRDVPGSKHFSQRIQELGYEVKSSGGSRVVGYRQGDSFYAYMM